MGSQPPVNSDNANVLTLQEYADQYCGGDRFRAIYELVDSDVAGSFDRHIDDLSQEEARFVLWLVQNSAVKAYGGQKIFDKALKANTLAETLGVDIDSLQSETPNPFAKKLVLSIIGIFAAIAITVVISIINQHFNTKIAYIGEVLIGLASMSVAGNITQFFRFCKLKKLASDLPSSEALKAKEYNPPPFEEAFALFNQSNASAPDIEREEAECLLRTSKKQIVKTLLWLMVFVVVAVICVFVAYGTGIVGGVIGALCLIAFFIWQMVTLFRRLIKSKAVGNVRGVDVQQQKAMDTQQSLLALAAIIIAGLYLISTVVGCLVSIMISLQG